MTLDESLKWADTFGPIQSNPPTGDGPALMTLAAEVRRFQASWVWQTSEPPKDGRLLVVFGRVFYTEDACTTVEPFKPSLVRWTEKDGESKGWHYLTGLSLAQALDDEVMIDGWMEVQS
jgi:hypothetical protein